MHPVDAAVHRLQANEDEILRHERRMEFLRGRRATELARLREAEQQDV